MARCCMESWQEGAKEQHSIYPKELDGKQVEELDVTQEQQPPHG